MPRIPFIFPEKGLNDTVNFPSQSPDSSSDCNNVRVFDPILKRQRGGSRPGLSKWYPNQLSGANRVQALIQAVEAAGTTGAEVEGRYAGGFAPTDGDANDVATFDYVDEANKVAITNTGGGLQQVIIDPTTGDIYHGGATGGDLHRANSAGVNQWSVTSGRSYEGMAYDSVNDMVCVDAGSGSPGVIQGCRKSDGAQQWTYDMGDRPYVIKYFAGHFYCCTDRNSGWTGAGGNSSVFKIKGDTGALIQEWDVATNGTQNIWMAVNPRTGRVAVWIETATTTYDDGSASANIFTLDKDLTLISAASITGPSDSSWLVFDKAQNVYLLARSGEMWKLDADSLAISWSVLAADGYIAGTGRGADVMEGMDYDPDRHEIIVCGEATGAGAGEWYNLSPQPSVLGNAAAVDPDTGFVTRALAFTTSAGAPISGTELQEITVLPDQRNVRTRKTSLVQVANGAITLVQEGSEVAVTNASGSLVTTPYTVQVATAYSDVFFVDGTSLKFLDLATTTVAAWTATSGGTIPALPRLIARWRGRIVLSGLVADPNNWFMSKLGDPFDWNYVPAVTSAIQAVAGNIGETGLTGDLVTGLAPFDDDTMIFGMDSSIGKMAGDPAAGGVIDVITEKTGMAWDAWALGPDNQMYFMGNDGIYRMGRDTIPVNMTEGILDGVFDNVDLSVNRVILEWDWRNKGLVVMIANTVSTTANQAYFFESRTGGWFPLAWPAAMGPDVLVAYDGEDADDRSLVLGCRDGYLRKPDSSATDDDGTTITSNVRFFPVSTRRGTDSRLYGLEVVLAEGSGDVTLKLYSAQTAEQCATSTEVRWSRTLKAGKNTLTLPRLSGAWLQIEFAATTRWGLESVFGLFEESGRSRRTKR